MTRRIRWAALGLLIATAISAGLLLQLLRGAESTSPELESRSVPIYNVHADHLTYPSPEDLKADADVVLSGRVTASETHEGTSPGVDGASDPLPAVPNTVYSVLAETVSKGAVTRGDTVKVSISGGTVTSGAFVVDTSPALAMDDVVLLFLKSASDGRYYPLAGGAAIAPRQTDGTFALSPNVTGGKAIAVDRAGNVPGPPRSPAATAPTPPAATTPTPPAATTPTPPAATTPTPQPGEVSAPVVTPVPGFSFAVARIAGQHLGSVLAKGLKLRVSCSSACAIKVSLTIGAAAATHLGLAVKRSSKLVTVGRGSRVGSGVTVVKLARAAVRQLRAAHVNALKLRATIALTASGRAVTARRVVRITRKRVTLT